MSPLIYVYHRVGLVLFLLENAHTCRSEQDLGSNADITRQAK